MVVKSQIVDILRVELKRTIESLAAYKAFEHKVTENRKESLTRLIGAKEEAIVKLIERIDSLV